MDEKKEQTFEVEVLTRLAVIESKLDKYSQIEDTTYRAYNNAKENTKDINYLKEKTTALEKEVETLKDQPRQRWFSLIGTIISVVITAIVTFALANIGLN